MGFLRKAKASRAACLRFMELLRIIVQDVAMTLKQVHLRRPACRTTRCAASLYTMADASGTTGAARRKLGHPVVDAPELRMARDYGIHRVGGAAKTSRDYKRASPSNF